MTADPRAVHLLPQACFDELAEVFCASHVDIRTGRKFGCACLKYGKRAFIALDGEMLAFRVGSLAPQLLERYRSLQEWNPRKGKRPKQSWLAHSAASNDEVALLAAIAFQKATEGLLPRMNRSLAV